MTLFSVLTPRGYELTLALACVFILSMFLQPVRSHLRRLGPASLHFFRTACFVLAGCALPLSVSSADGSSVAAALWGIALVAQILLFVIEGWRGLNLTEAFAVANIMAWVTFAGPLGLLARWFPHDAENRERLRVRP